MANPRSFGGAGCAGTLVIQTFRYNNVPDWISRCLNSVRYWAELHGFNYLLQGDEFYDLCGPDYLARCGGKPQTITNLARLVAARQFLDAGYDCVIWMDADMFVFDPEGLRFDFSSDLMTVGYAFGREVWMSIENNEQVRFTQPMMHNAAALFTRAAIDLDMLIATIRHIVAGREISSNYQVGVELLRGLQYSLGFPTFSHAAMFSPTLMRAIVDGNAEFLRLYGQAYRYPSCAANLCLSLQQDDPEDVLWRAMDLLEKDRGAVLNRHATETGAHLLPPRAP